MSLEPTYLRIYEEMKRRINSGFYPDRKLPSERALLADLDGTRITVREALTRLEQEGVIYRLNRRGWFAAAPRICYSPHHKSHFIKAALEQGRKPKTKVLHFEEYTAAPEEAAHMGAQATDLKFNHLVRLRELDSHPALYESIWLNARLTPDILSFDLNQSLTELMHREYGLEIQRTDVRVLPCVLTGQAAERLLVREGTVGLSIFQQRFDQHGNLLEYDHELWRYDVIELAMRFESQSF